MQKKVGIEYDGVKYEIRVCCLRLLSFVSVCVFENNV